MIRPGWESQQEQRKSWQEIREEILWEERRDWNVRNGKADKRRGMRRRRIYNFTFTFTYIYGTITSVGISGLHMTQLPWVPRTEMYHCYSTHFHKFQVFAPKSTASVAEVEARVWGQKLPSGLELHCSLTPPLRWISSVAFTGRIILWTLHSTRFLLNPLQTCIFILLEPSYLLVFLLALAVT